MTFCGGVIVVERQESGNTPVPLGSWNKLMKTVRDRQGDILHLEDTDRLAHDSAHAGRPI